MSASPDPSPSSSTPAGHLRTHPYPHHHNLHLSTPPPPQPHPPAAPGPLAVTPPHQQALAPYSAPPPSPASTPRDYRKGNWTLHETLVLITAKRLDDDRRAGGGVAGSSSSSPAGPSALPRSAEQRWKWVENYCWSQGCLRSQNQCNDKWDNLLRDYKKVRDFHNRLASNSTAPSGSGAAPAAAAPLPTSYWAMERHERKERNLPTNLAAEVYDALCDVLSRRAARRGGAPVAPSPPPPLALPAPPLHPPPKPLLSQQQQRIPPHHPPLLQLPPPPVAVAPPPTTTSVSGNGPLSVSNTPYSTT
ncbi:hypothetical protein BRADI_5g25700v3 [Brachypodium distachyon]|uniref:Myb-like domain-containing protein n=1 Tax=Brachypodium distachyon TaxID=15368 RepID=A0A2K2CJA7_BRADI|nr:hypothetical protein BRADI_5g25700v3 [Brachypodium distachyon]